MAISKDMVSEALQLMSMPGTLRFTKHGEWLHDGARVTHDQIARYFSKHLTFNKQHDSYVIAVAGRCVVVEVEDTPVVVTAFDETHHPWRILLNTGEWDRFEPGTLSVSDENVLYCRVAQDTACARILRPAMARLWPLVREEGGNYFIEIDGQRFAVQRLVR